MKKFNYDNIYNKSMTKEELEYYRLGMNKIYNRYLKDIETKNKNSIIYTLFLNYQNIHYLNNTSSKRKAIDFIAGMTDDLFKIEIEKA